MIFFILWTAIFNLTLWRWLDNLEQTVIYVLTISWSVLSQSSSFKSLNFIWRFSVSTVFCFSEGRSRHEGGVWTSESQARGELLHGRAWRDTEPRHFVPRCSACESLCSASTHKPRRCGARSLHSSVCWRHVHLGLWGNIFWPHLPVIPNHLVFPSSKLSAAEFIHLLLSGMTVLSQRHPFTHSGTNWKLFCSSYSSAVST